MPAPLTSLLWFLAIIALIPLALWLLKRSPLAGGGSGPAGTPRALAVLPLAAQQRLVTVEVGQGDERRWLVLGVSPQAIHLLHTMKPEAGFEPPPEPAAPFAQLMSRLNATRAGDRNAG
ncbi:FliO/MopB family protein [Rubrivivax sp. A210]|uniref:FliO/MopB family protein n=1 Tax=Rubrivivax sp. A210 TaxID=2772301 RepID=UPI001918C670|nr:flagellar biosynthetic protein FliO [Rubrivivax sp. A210]